MIRTSIAAALLAAFLMIGPGPGIAQANFAEMLEGGEGLRRDPARAWAWYRVAAAGGNSWAKNQARRLLGTLRPVDRDRAGALLRRVRKEIAAKP
jgi:TPR repeat protein